MSRTKRKCGCCYKLLNDGKQFRSVQKQLGDPHIYKRSERRNELWLEKNKYL